MKRARPHYTLLLLMLCLEKCLSSPEAESPDTEPADAPVVPEPAAATISPEPADEPLECVFSNLKEIIGHNKYSLFGILENCAIFYVTGDRLDGTQLNISEIEGHLDGCYNPLPLFYKQKGKFKVLVAQKTSAYLNGCKFDNRSDTYRICDFSRDTWTKRSFKPTADDDDEIIGHFTDVDTDILHVIYKNEKSNVLDAMFNLTTFKLLKREPMKEKDIGRLSFDSDLNRLYYMKSKMGYRDVTYTPDLFTYGAQYKNVLNFTLPKGPDDFFSFSNQFYIIRKDEPDELIKYYAGREGNSTSLCFLEAKQSDGIKMILFVDGGDRSAYQRIRAQFMPEPPDLPTSIETSSEAIHSTNPEHDHASTMMISLALILPITYFIS